VDSNHVSCWWLAADDPVKIAPIAGPDLFVVNDEIKADIGSDLLSGKGERICVQAATTVATRLP
jgi:hypothetical protein